MIIWYLTDTFKNNILEIVGEDMRLEKFKERNHKQFGIIVFTIICILLVSGVVLYRTFAIFEVKTNQNVINGTLEDPGNIYFAFYVDNNIQKEMPQIHSGYILDEDASYCGINGQDDEKIHVSLTEDYTVHVSGMTTSRTKCNLYFVKGAFILGKPVKAVTSGDGLYEVKHEDSSLDEGFKQTEWRYAGTNPNNYIKFNDEDWRIIGLVNVMIDEDNTIEQRVKIVRNESIGSFAWDKDDNNDWTKSSLMEMLNGIYYNSESGECWNTSDKTESVCNFDGSEKIKGLNSLSHDMIDEDISWNTGYGMRVNSYVNDLYEKERGSNSYNGQAIVWNKENSNFAIFHGVGLIYPSDYGYTTDGGEEGRDACLSKILFNIQSNDTYSLECYNSSWIKPNSKYIWTITSRNDGNIYAYGIDPNLSIYTSNGTYHALQTYPSLYLKQSIKIVDNGQDGSQEKPYTLSL